MRFNHLLHLIAFPWKAHGRPPASGFVSATKMPDSRAFSKLSDQFQPLHTPISHVLGEARILPQMMQVHDGCSPMCGGETSLEAMASLRVIGAAPFAGGICFPF